MLRKLSYEDFDIRFERPVQKNGWRVLAESREGNAEGAFVLSSGDDHEDEVLRNGPWVDAEILERYGVGLYESLFTADVRALFITSFRSAKSEGKGLRVRLRADEGELSLLPWELLRRSDINVALAQSEWHPVVRFIQLPFSMRPLSIVGRLRILLVSATPSDQDTLDVEAEAASIARAMAPLSEQVEVVPLPRAGKLDLFRAVADGYHVVHFMAHGRLDEAGEGELMLQGEDGSSDPLSASELRALAHDWAQAGTRLLVFNACETARDRPGRAFSGIATAAVQAGIPAVISMQYPISDLAAGYFSNELYRALAQGCPVDQAVTNARMAVQLRVKDGHEWITPVLHMRATDGVLFEGTAAPVPRLGFEKDVQAQNTLRATTRRTATPVAATKELVLRVGPGRVRATSTLGEAEGPLTGASALSAAFVRALRRGMLKPDDIRGFGLKLFAAAFQGDVEPLVNRVLSEAAAGLSVRIVLEDDKLIELPWEALYHPRKQTFVALAGGKRPLRLEIEEVEPIQTDRLVGPVRMLFVACRPLDMGFLDLEREWNWLQAGLKEYSASEITVDVLMDPTPRAWIEKLSSAEYHILHFAGYDTHAYTNFAKDEGIMLVGEEGERRDVVREELVQLLQGFPSLRLAVFNSCFTLHSLAPALVRCGIPSVIGMRGFTMDDVAMRFTTIFYPMLVRMGWRIDAALAETRRLLYLEPTETTPAAWHGPALLTAVQGNDFFPR